MIENNVENWSAKWTNVGTKENTKYLAMFSSPKVNVNVIHTVEQAQEALEEKSPTPVPRQVIFEALRSLDIASAA
jgi:hypothetical protein